MYVIEVEHRGLNKHRVIRGHDQAVVERKAELQCAAWDEQWEAKVARQAAQANKEAKAAEATARTMEAQRAIQDLGSILSHTLQVDDVVDWESLKRTFSEPGSPPRRPSAEHFAPAIGLLDHVFPSRKRRKIEAGKARYDQALQQWQLDLRRWNGEAQALEQAVSEHNAAIDAQRLRYLNDDTEAIAEYCDLVLARSSYPDFFPQEFQVRL
jgi:restriction system protein